MYISSPTKRTCVSGQNVSRNQTHMHTDTHADEHINTRALKLEQYLSTVCCPIHHLYEIIFNDRKRKTANGGWSGTSMDYLRLSVYLSQLKRKRTSARIDALRWSVSTVDCELWMRWGKVAEAEFHRRGSNLRSITPSAKLIGNVFKVPQHQILILKLYLFIYIYIYVYI